MALQTGRNGQPAQSQQQQWLDLNVWHTAGFRRVLITGDVLANLTTLLILVLGFVRMQQQLPQHQSLHDAFLGPKRPFFHMTFAIPAYAMTSLCPLAWLLYRPATYFKHRTALVLSVRSMRLLVQLLTMLSPKAVLQLAAIIIGRMHARPNMGLAMLLGHPMAFYLQHALFLLPWRLVLAFQLASTAAMLNWAFLLPCCLQQQQQQLPSSLSTQPWQACAEAACSTLQSCVALLRSAVGAAPSELSPDACQGQRAAQVLLVFCNICCLLVAPVAVCYQLERWEKLRHAQQQQQEAQLAAAVAAGTPADAVGSSSAASSSASSASVGSSRDLGAAASSSGSAAAASSSSSSWQSGSSSSSSNTTNNGSSLPPGQNPQRTVRNINSLTVSELVGLSCGVDGRGAACGYGCVPVLLLLLGAPCLWLLSEALVDVFDASRDCAAVLGALGS